MSKQKEIRFIDASQGSKKKKTIFHWKLNIKDGIGISSFLEPTTLIPEDFTNTKYLGNNNELGDMFYCWCDNYTEGSLFFGNKGNENFK